VFTLERIQSEIVPAVRRAADELSRGLGRYAGTRSGIDLPGSAHGVTPGK